MWAKQFSEPGFFPAPDAPPSPRPARNLPACDNEGQGVPASVAGFGVWGGVWRSPGGVLSLADVFPLDPRVPLCLRGKQRVGHLGRSTFHARSGPLNFPPRSLHAKAQGGVRVRRSQKLSSSQLY